jgi:hypothetical protein
VNPAPASALDAAGPALLGDTLRAAGTVRLRALGGSMEPAIRPRDILVIAGCGVDDLAPRDVVLFVRDGRLFAHRLLEIAIRSGRRVLRTRGDAIWSADAPVDAAEVMGRVVAVGRGGLFRPPPPCTPWARACGLLGSEWTALRVRIRR